MSLYLLVISKISKGKSLARSEEKYQSQLCTPISFLIFLYRSFETSLVFWSWSEDMRVVGYNPQIIFIIYNLSLTFITFPAFFAFSAINILSMSIDIYVVQYLWVQMLLQFYSILYETSVSAYVVA